MSSWVSALHVTHLGSAWKVFSSIGQGAGSLGAVQIASARTRRAHSAGPTTLPYDGFQSPAAGPASGRVSPESHDAIDTIVIVYRYDTRVPAKQSLAPTTG